MKVRVISTVISGGRVVKAGEIVEMTRAQALSVGGNEIPVSEPEKKVIEKRRLLWLKRKPQERDEV